MAPMTAVREDQMTDDRYDIADRIEAALERAARRRRGLVPSEAARKARTNTTTAAHVLAWLAAHQYAHTTGRGGATRYHAGRSGPKETAR